MSSRSFMDAIRGVVISEGAKDKTSDGMTKDAKRFAQDLHKVTDAGMKHLVQKDSETKDYERMFSGGVDKAPTRLADVEPGKDVDKYVEYNEAVEKKSLKKDGKDKDDKDKDDKIDAEPDGDAVNEVAMGGSAPAAAQRQVGQSQRFRPATPAPAAAPAAAPKPAASGAPTMKPGTTLMKPNGWNPFTGTGTAPVTQPANPAGGTKAQSFGPGVAAAAKRANMSGGGTASNLGKQSGSGTTIKPASAPVKSPMASQGAPGPSAQTQFDQKQAQKATAAKPANLGAALRAGAKSGQKTIEFGGKKYAVAFKDKKYDKAIKSQGIKAAAQKQAGQAQRSAPTAPPKMDATNTKASKPMSASYEVEWNGKSYVMNEAQIEAMDAFISKYGVVNEGTAGEFIKKEMEHPEKLTAKGNKQKIKQSLAIYYSKKRRGENP